MPASSTAVTSAGTTVSISATLPASLTKTAYAALTWTLIGEITDAGEIGRVYNEVTHQPLATRGIQKRKGSFNDGTMTLQMAYAPGDAGQVLIETALADDNAYSIKIALQNGSVVYAKARVMSAPVGIGNVDSITSQTVQLSIESGSIVKSHPA